MANPGKKAEFLQAFERLTVTELAEIMGLTTSRIHQFVKMGMPKAGRGEYSLPACLAWYKARWTDKATADNSLDEQRRALLYEQTKKTRLENEATEANLLSADEIEAASKAMMCLFNGALEPLPGDLCDEIAGMTDASQIQTLLAAACRQARRELSDQFGQLAETIMAEGEKAPAA